jgi:putative sigma-54 modulation protein
MQITIKAKNIDLTEKIKDYAEEKISSLEKFFDNIITARIEVGMESKHHLSGKIYYTTVNLNVPGNTLRVEKHAKSLEKSIDKVKDHLQRELKRYKSKFDTKGNESIREMEIEIEEE